MAQKTTHKPVIETILDPNFAQDLAGALEKTAAN